MVSRCLQTFPHFMDPVAFPETQKMLVLKPQSRAGRFPSSVLLRRVSAPSHRSQRCLAALALAKHLSPRPPKGHLSSLPFCDFLLVPTLILLLL